EEPAAAISAAAKEEVKEAPSVEAELSKLTPKAETPQPQPQPASMPTPTPASPSKGETSSEVKVKPSAPPASTPEAVQASGASVELLAPLMETSLDESAKTRAKELEKAGFDADSIRLDENDDAAVRDLVGKINAAYQ